MRRRKNGETARSWSRRDLLKTGLAAGAGLSIGGCNIGRRRPNVVVVSIDTLRADGLHCYGNLRETSPCIDQLAREGVRFRNAFSPAPWTLPAHLSLFTSQEPGRYFQSVGTAGWSGDKTAYPIFYKHQQDAPTIASVLRDRGYDTIGFHGALLTDAVWGLDFGFRDYTFSNTDDQFIRASSYVREQARSDQPFVLFVHTYVVHRPFRYEAIFGDQTQRPAELAGMNFLEDRLSNQEVTPVDPAAPLYGWRPSPEAIAYFRTVYDGGVRAADQHLQGLVDTLKDVSLYDETAIVVTSDHGEEFWEHIPECSPDHNHSLFDELLRIPLVVKWPHSAHAGREIDGLARITDIGPTLFDIAGVASGDGATGRSLLPYLTASGAAPERHLYAGCTHMGPTRYAIRTSQYKYIECPQTVSFRPHFEVPPQALYDLQADPREQRNLIGELPEVADDLRRRLARDRQADLPISLTLDDPLTRSFMPAMGLESHALDLIAQGKTTAELPMTEEASAELLESLRSLGYL